MLSEIIVINNSLPFLYGVSLFRKCKSDSPIVFKGQISNKTAFSKVFLALQAKNKTLY